MKTLHMVLSKVQMIICNNPLIFSILCIGLIACNLMFIYTYGLNEEFISGTNVADYYMYQYENAASMTVESVKHTLSELEDEYDADYMTVIDNNATFVAEGYNDYSEYLIRTREDAISFFKLHTGNIKNLNAADTVIVPSDFSVSIDETIILNGIEFRVVGTTSSEYFIVSLENYLMHNFNPNIVALQILDNGASENIISKLFSENYHVEYVKNQAIENDARTMMYEAYLLYVLCAMTFLFLCTYIYDDSAYELNVYQMLGASQGRIITILGGAMFVILSVVNIITQIIHVILYDSFFSKLFTNGGYVYSFMDYIKIFIASTALVFSFIILYIIIKSRKSTILNARKTIN